MSVLDRKKAWLILKDGTVYEGKSIGVEGKSLGELVCSTAMTGYQETLTDSGYYGQLVTQTFPMIGNYGVNSFDSGSKPVWAKGSVVRELCEEPSNFRCEGTLEGFLKEKGVVGICDVDTRAITRKLRKNGVMNAAIVTEYPADAAAMAALLQEIASYSPAGGAAAVSCKKAHAAACDNPRHTVVVYDLGAIGNLVKGLLARHCNVIMVPCNASLKDVLQYHPDAFVLSNGPGSPEELPETLAVVKDLMETGLPLYGVGLGHQVMALAAGAKVEKMVYGHRGGNQPVRDLSMDKVLITSQNHGYVVTDLPEEAGTVSHVNVNDNSCEGIRYSCCNGFSVQFLPETSGGPLDTHYLLDELVSRILANKQKLNFKQK
ncbi:MAG: glutamine-hydrolyzing carbamoyl-phosphate synthase small subunit [Firmicutes bacterium]|nr:glutamine-hydrolyzing carbamoyl-phosphate synthase small subunit [Bacillota bacterium]